MSYIRAMSNPENLYIWGEGDGNVSISSGARPWRRNMPVHTFHEILKRWYASDDRDEKPVKYRGARIEFVTPGFKWRLSYKGWIDPVDMYESTLTYLCAENAFRWENSDD